MTRQTGSVVPSADLQKIEDAVAAVSALPSPVPGDAAAVNPTLVLLEAASSGTTAFRSGEGEAPRELLAVWKDRQGDVHCEVAGAAIVLALKVILEGLDPESVAEEASVPVAAIDSALDGAAARDVLLVPPPAIRRPEGFAPEGTSADFLAARIFTLQWHVTSECDLHCLHCYDRTRRPALPLPRAKELLREFRRFCRGRYVAGQVSFTGGNPLLYDDFDDLYREAADLGLASAILGNPVPGERLKRVLDIAQPSYFQVSLEGLPEHNDRIRGKGNFEAVLRFLDLLRECGVFSVVMLTLTGENISQVLPLGRILQGRASLFSFNRLARFGEGAELALPDRERFSAFLREYLAETKLNPVLGRKDNLLNLVHRERGEDPFGGCTGFGCGAAFNFLSLLSDGEVHACRKFPSPLGSIETSSIAAIYDSAEAGRYRSGSAACRGCELRAVCGGCLAVGAGTGLDPLTARDPFCFLDT